MRRTAKYPQVTNVVRLLNDRAYNPDMVMSRVRSKMQFDPFIHSIELATELNGHHGCVNSLEWSEDGRLLASASDDYHVMIWDPFQGKRVHNLETGHRGNIFSVKFLPMSNNGTLATGAADSKILVFDISRNEAPTLRCNCHKSRVKRLATAADQPFMFWSAAEDGHVFQFDLREPHHCRSNDKIMLINLKNHTGRYSEAKCIAVNQVRTEQLVVGAHDCYARLYDRRMISVTEVADFMEDTDDSGGESSGGGVAVVTDNLPKGCVQYYCPGHLGTLKQTVTHRAATFVTFSPKGTELLMNVGSEQIYLFDINNAKVPQFLNLPAYQQPSDGGDDTVMAESPKRLMTEEVEKQKKLGNDHLENENYLQAIFQYTMAIQKAPECPVLYLNRATALMRRKWFGDFYDALKDCHTALHLDPGYIKAHFRLARALLELNHADEANACLEELKRRFPVYAKNHGVMMLKKDITMEQQQRNKKEERPSRNEFSELEAHWRRMAKDYKDRFVGHCNSKTDIKEANFMGQDGNYIIAGSDDGNFFIWERPTNMVTEVVSADKSIVNCVQPHPFCCLVATSGIDHEIRLWSPQPEDVQRSHKAEYVDLTVNENQQRMQSDPFEMATGPVCRTS